MGCTLITNVGNRDVALSIAGIYVAADGPYGPRDLQGELGCDSGVRAIGQAIHDRLGDFEKRLRFPIIEPALEFVLGHEKFIDTLLIVGTDQPEGTPSYHRSRDTWHYANVICDCVAKTYGDRIGVVEPIKREASPPEAEAEAFFGNLIDKHIPSSSEPRVYALMKGGVPGMNSALVWQVVHTYGSNASILTVPEPPDHERAEGATGTARREDTWPLRKQGITRILKALLDRSEYHAAHEFLRAEGVDAPRAMAFVEHAAARQNHDFERAYDALDQYPTGRSGQWRVSASEDRSLSLQRPVEVASAADLLLERGDYVGFVTRAAMFTEVCRRFVVTQLGVDVMLEAQLPLDAVDQLAGLGAALRRDVGAPPWHVNKASLNAVIAWGSRCEAQGDAVHDVQAAIGSFGRLERLRNEAVHVLRGVSKNDVVKVLFRKRELEGLDRRQRLELDARARFCDLADAVVAATRAITAAPTHPVDNIYDEIAEAVLAEIATSKGA